ncbi:hypothetical protein_gp231 [Bacillus phage vB_BceM_WH1]|nr:hypothetical protein_gp231 [Bacillus phage vB_BceM_WH1]
MPTPEYKSVYAEISINGTQQYTEYRIFKERKSTGGFPPEMVPIFEKMGVEILDHWDIDWHNKGWRSSDYVTPGEISYSHYLKKREKQNNHQASLFMNEEPAI